MIIEKAAFCGRGERLFMEINIFNFFHFGFAFKFL